MKQAAIRFRRWVARYGARQRRARRAPRLANLLLATALTVCVSATADESERLLPMWQIDGDQNRLYVLGSVHLLRERDHPLPNAIDRAFDDADTLIMELDLDDSDPVASQALVDRLGRIQDGRTLADWLGTDAYRQAAHRAAQADVPLERLGNTEPWLAAITVEQMVLSRAGFDSALGVEAYLVGKAASAQKDILGLETLEQQLSVLDGLSLGAQRLLLLQTLDDAADGATTMNSLVGAWRRGDTAFLEREMLAEVERSPELHAALVVARNRNWVEQIVALLDDEQNYLIVVGALHLVGDDSLLALLRGRGVTAKQLRPMR